MSVAQFDERVKEIALKVYREKGIRPSCDRCWIMTDPTCPDFPHICELKEALKRTESKAWILAHIDLSVFHKRGNDDERN